MVITKLMNVCSRILFLPDSLESPVWQNTTGLRASGSRNRKNSSINTERKWQMFS